MDTFNITECELFWDTRKKTPKRDRQAIKKEINALSTIIGKTILFLKEAALDGAEPTVTFLLGGNSEYKLALWLANSASLVQAGTEPCFEMNIQDQSGQYIAYVCSEKFKIVLCLLEGESEYLKSDTEGD